MKLLDDLQYRILKRIAPCEPDILSGGLNQMSIRRFERLVQQSPFVCESIDCVPIRKLRSSTAG